VLYPAELRARKRAVGVHHNLGLRQGFVKEK
jgi:hypothetical protein